MAEPVACPEPDRLRQMLDGRLPADEQSALSSHLDTCVNCQQTLEGLASGGLQLPDAAQLAQAPAESALRKAMDALRGDPSKAVTEAGPDTTSDNDLAFLSPCDTSGTLGRLGIYEVREVLGRGGMGIVFQAFDPALQRVVAVKVLAPHLATEMNRKRFLREARAAAAVRHANVVTVHAVEEAGPLPYFVMEYVPGPSLQERLDCEGPPDLATILELAIQISDGLAAAHTQGLIHRDIKPANVLLQSGGQAKLTDFGLARAVDDVSLTQRGVVAGTPQYMAPEQARGAALDHRADLFSLGSLLYALCTGKAPFAGENTVAVLFNVCSEMARPVCEINPAVHDGLAAVIDKLHAKNPADRFTSAAEVAALLRQHLAHLRDPRVPKPEAPERVVLVTTPVVPPHLARLMGREYRSKTTVFGWPLVHIATGYDPITGKPRIARGVFAFGNISVGAVAFGGVALGGIAVGGVSAGLVALGGVGLGLMLGIGGVAVGFVALGGGAVGYYALGGGALGVHAFGGNVQDPQIKAWFRSWFGLP